MCAGIPEDSLINYCLLVREAEVYHGIRQTADLARRRRRRRKKQKKKERKKSLQLKKEEEEEEEEEEERQRQADNGFTAGRK